jgi:glycine/D-amino acid oxidase-like deaminating enzyme
MLLGWRLWQRGVGFRFEGDRQSGASRAAAGLVNPVTGKGMNSSWRLEEFLPEMKAFYLDVGSVLGRKYFREQPVLRIFSNENEAAKFKNKRSQLKTWIGEVYSVVDDVKHGQWGGVEWHGGGWLDVKGFVKDSLAFFAKETVVASTPDVTVYCEGAKGLRSGPFSYLPQRLAKGQILEVAVPDWNEQRILNRNGWCIPIGEDQYRIGATYEWKDLDSEPTEHGRAELENLVAQFTDLPFTVLSQVAGVRPIVRTSQPIIGKHPRDQQAFIFNGLGSKGCLYGPKVAQELVTHLLDGQPIDPDLDVTVFAKDQ